MATLGFVGMGVMGAPMAGHLLREGHDVGVWNRTPARAEPILAQGAWRADSLTDLGARADLVFVCVNRTEDVEACLAGLVPGGRVKTIVDHSTISPTAARAIHDRLAPDGVEFLDAPITGGSMGAQRGQLTVFCGGSAEAYERARPYMDAYSKRTAHVGDAGAGQMMKMANQIAVGGALLGLCESLAFARRAGLDLTETRDLLSGGAAGSWAMDNYGPKILADDWSPGFSVKNQRKDFAYCLEAAAAIDAAVPGTELVDHLLAVLEDEGRGEEATCALFDVLARGVTDP